MGFERRAARFQIAALSGACADQAEKEMTAWANACYTSLKSRVRQSGSPMPRRKPQKLSFKPVVVRPCEESWGEMTGTLRERHCPLCDKKVHNFAAMTVAEIERLTLESGGHMCARITQRKDGSLVTLESSPRVSFAAQIAVSASLAIGGAGAAGQTGGQSKQPDAVLTGRVIRPDGSGPVPAAVIRLKNGTVEVAKATADTQGKFRIQVQPGTYDLYLRQNAFFGERIVAVNLHSGEQSVQAVEMHLSIEGREDDPNALTTMGEVSVTFSIRYSLKSAIRHPWSYLKYLARKL